MTRRPLAPLAILLCMALSSSAWAAPKVAVTPIDGDTESEIRDALADAIDTDEFKLISKKETSKAVDKIGDISDFTEKDAKKLAKDLSADAIVTGSLEKDGATKTLKVKLFVNGEMKKGFSIKFKKASGKFKEALRKTLAKKLDGTTEMAAKASKADADDDENPLPKPKKGDKAEKAVKNSKAEKAEKAEGEGEGEGDGEGDGEKAASGDGDGEKAASGDDEGTKPAAKRTAALDDDLGDDPAITRRGKPGVQARTRSANRASARLDIGASIVKRSMVFTSNLDANRAPKPFRPKPVLGTRTEAEIYPLGFLNPDSFVAGLGFAFELDRTLRMNTFTSAEMGTAIPTDQFRYAAGVRFRLVGKSPTSPSVTVGGDLGRSRFQPQVSVLMDPYSLDLPETYYKYVAPHLSFRIPIGRFLAFHARGEGLFVQDAGEIVRAYSYGRAKVLGIDVEGGLDIVFLQRFAVRLTGGFIQYGYQFQGDGGFEANSRDGDPSTRDVGGAADRSITAAMTLAVMY